jgi:hypothetical protein
MNFNTIVISTSKVKRIYILLILLTLLNSIYSHTKDSKKIQDLFTMTAIEISEMDFTAYTLDNYFEAFAISQSILKDSKQNNNEMRSSILLSSLANQIEIDIKNKKINIHDKQLIALLSKFEKENYFVYKPKLNKFIKLMRYTCLGDYGHIYKRFKDSSYFFLITIFLLIIFLIITLSFTKKIRFKNQNTFNQIIKYTIILIIIIAIFFKLTCYSQVEEYSFYGIPM